MARRGGGGGKQDPLEKFWSSVDSQKMDTLRWSLSNCNNVTASTHNDDGMTSFMLAASKGKFKSLEMLIDFYSRNSALREAGWLECKDEQGRTALMYAAEQGQSKCVDHILDARPMGRGDRKDINDHSYALHLVSQKDGRGKTALDYATKNKRTEVIEMLEEFINPPKEPTEEEKAKNNPEGISSTQMSKQKKRALLEQCGGDSMEKSKEQEKIFEQRVKQENDAQKTADAIKSRTAIWKEIQKVDSQAEKTSKICELTITRTEVGEDCPAYGDAANPCDPALWDLAMLNRLSLKLPKGILTTVPSSIEKLQSLQILILSGNALTSLPDEMGKLANLKVFEVEHNKLTSIPSTLSKCSKLEVVKVGNNALTSLDFLSGLSNLTIVSAPANKLTSLDGVPFAKCPRLSELSCPQNEITEIPDEISACPIMSRVQLSNNLITEVPFAVTTLKKVKELALLENPLSDNKVKKYLDMGGKGMKDLWKYLEKNAKKGGGGGKKNKKKKKQVDSDDEEDEE